MSADEGRIRVMVVDDHAMVREGIAALVAKSSHMEVVAQASDGAEAIRLHQQHHPDVTLMDLRLPDMSGIDVISVIRAARPDSRFIVLTTYDGDEDIFHAVRAGARGYLLKGMTAAELVQTIELVHAGQRRIPPELAMRLAERMGEASFGERELAVLRLVVAGKTNREIATALSLHETTVKGYLRTVFEKLGVKSRTQAVMAALQRGLAKLDR